VNSPDLFDKCLERDRRRFFLARMTCRLLSSDSKNQRNPSSERREAPWLAAADGTTHSAPGVWRVALGVPPDVEVVRLAARNER
jgi:hypothetical protein